MVFQNVIHTHALKGKVPALLLPRIPCHYHILLHRIKIISDTISPDNSTHYRSKILSPDLCTKSKTTLTDLRSCLKAQL